MSDTNQPAVNVPKDTEFKASDVKKAADVSYRQLNDWETKGVIPKDKERGEGWRKFTPREVFTVLVCSELRKQFNFSLESLAKIRAFMLKDGANHFQYAVETMNQWGCAIWLLTTPDGETFILEKDTEIKDLFDMGYFRTGVVNGYALLFINPLVNRILGCLKTPIELPIRDHFYKMLNEVRHEMNIRSNGELHMLRHVRRKDVDAVTAHVTDGEITQLDVDEEAVKLDQPLDGNMVLQTLKSDNFQTVTVKVHDGKISRLNRRVPIKFPKATGKPA